MNEELLKSITSLIEETISEIEDLKKSRFSASEVKLAGPGEDGLKGQPANGKLDKEEDKDEDEDDDKKDKKEDKDMDKAEGKNKEADPGPVHHSGESVAKEEDKKDDKDEDKKDDKKDKKEMDKAEGKNKQADPGPVHHGADGGMKKSSEEDATLMKSYIDSRVAPLETKLNSILDLVGKIAEQPVPAKGASAKNFAFLSKSAEGEAAPLSKSEVANKLFELKKSGANVDSADITAAELGTTKVQDLISKYNLK